MSEKPPYKTQDDKWIAIDDYIAENFLEADPALDAALAASEAAGLPAIQVAPLQGKLLMMLAAAMGARRILEIGTLGGYSTIWLAHGLAEGGRLITLDMNPDYAEVARGNIANAGLADRVEIRVGKALDTLPLLEAEGAGPFDLIFIDADKPSTPDYFDWAVRLARQGSLIVVDNVVREGAILAAQSDNKHVKGLRGFYARAAADPRVTATAIQTVGNKGHDGLAIMLVTAEPD
ncbi:methyltransferase [Methyloceanibacter superfactus]|uniref:Methyltransferase n=1 Tax=Methyloceanibacter superfactus TaxID=1774969 RepID=A0A1E3VJM6_9HYPH|nr:O-methyltransferase [Methyloceanibacter superfactus]ODR93714.1 methyltransferase [Methyloceanibacter superfactus]